MKDGNCGNCKHSGKKIDISKNKSIFYTPCSYTGAYHNINDKNKCHDIFYIKNK